MSQNKDSTLRLNHFPSQYDLCYSSLIFPTMYVNVHCHGLFGFIYLKLENGEKDPNTKYL